MSETADADNVRRVARSPSRAAAGWVQGRVSCTPAAGWVQGRVSCTPAAGSVPLQLTGYRAGCPGGESSPRSRPSVSSYSAAAFAFLPGAGDGDRPCHARCGETPAAADSLLPTSCCRGHRPRPAATVPPSRPRSGALHSVVRGAPRGRPARLSGESILTGRRARRRPSVGDQCRRGARRWRHSRRANGADDRRRHRTARPTHPRRRRRRRHWNVRPGRRDGTVRDCLPDAPPSKDAGPC